MKHAFLLFAALFMPYTAFCSVIIVPDDCSGIQQAVDAAVNGDTLPVRPGT